MKSALRRARRAWISAGKTTAMASRAKCAKRFAPDTHINNGKTNYNKAHRFVWRAPRGTYLWRSAHAQQWLSRRIVIFSRRWRMARQRMASKHQISDQ